LLPYHSTKVLKWIDFVPQETLYWKRDAWNLVGQHVDENFSFAMDWDFLLRLSRARAAVCHIPVVLGLFRVQRSK
jgi:hypothetical protein